VSKHRDNFTFYLFWYKSTRNWARR